MHYQYYVTDTIMYEQPTNLCPSLEVEREHVIALSCLALSYEKYPMPLLSTLGDQMRRFKTRERAVKPGVWCEWMVFSGE